jgi:hypothetical protein
MTIDKLLVLDIQALVQVDSLYVVFPHFFGYFEPHVRHLKRGFKHSRNSNTIMLSISLQLHDVFQFLFILPLEAKTHQEAALIGVFIVIRMALNRRQRVLFPLGKIEIRIRIGFHFVWLVIKPQLSMILVYI